MCVWIKLIASDCARKREKCKKYIERHFSPVSLLEQKTQKTIYIHKKSSIYGHKVQKK